MLYPLKFIPLYKEKIWGGSKFTTALGRDDLPSGNWGESWEISGVYGNISIVKNGFLKNNSLQELVDIYMGDLVGDKVFDKFGYEFPLLIKFIDANDILSLQVHPDDELAKKRHSAFGKTEMWYVLEADNDAELITGFNKSLNKEQFKKYFDNGKIKEILNYEKVNNGDSFFIPAGRIHATGAGILFAEIQQTSNITYRVYDWDRKNNDGLSRELHSELAIDALDLKKQDNYRNDYLKRKNQVNNILTCNYFTCNYHHITKKCSFDYNKIDSFVIYICTEGKFDLYNKEKETLKVTKGESVLIPAVLDEIEIIPYESTKILEVYIA